MRTPEGEAEVRELMAYRRAAQADGVSASVAHARWATRIERGLSYERLVLWRTPWHELPRASRDWVRERWAERRRAEAGHQREVSRLINEVAQAMRDGGER